MAKAEIRTSSKGGNVAKDMLSATVVEHLMDSVGEKFLDMELSLKTQSELKNKINKFI